MRFLELQVVTANLMFLNFCMKNLDAQEQVVWFFPILKLLFVRKWLLFLANHGWRLQNIPFQNLIILNTILKAYFIFSKHRQLEVIGKV